jgi:hypothetical protein
MKIVAAAIMHQGVLHTLPLPARHHDVIKVIWKLIGKMVTCEIQGFVTDEGKFVNRTEAGVIAIASGQLTALPHPPELYSEDLW